MKITLSIMKITLSIMKMGKVFQSETCCIFFRIRIFLHGHFVEASMLLTCVQKRQFLDQNCEMGVY